MNGDRYVLLGLAPPRSAWFSAVSQWTTSASLAGEFVKCLSGEEVRARLASGRLHSALLVDLESPDFDRDLVAAARAASTPVVAVAGARGPDSPHPDVAVTAVLEAGFTLDDLIEVLIAHVHPIKRGDSLPPGLGDESAPPWRAQLITVCGPGGTGASTVAAALAQGLSADPRFGRRVLLADLALRADHAMLHNVTELGPGLQEVVEAHRLGRPDPDDLRRSTFDIPGRGYQLLIGLRRPAAWAVLRPRAVETTIDGLRQAWQLVVADVTGDVEGENETGSADVEERNALARTATIHSDVVAVVGSTGLKGVHSLTLLIQSLISSGVDASRILTVINRAPRGPRAHAQVSSTLASLLGDTRVTGPVFVPERKVEDCFRDGLQLPLPVVAPAAGGVRAMLARLADAAPATAPVAAITPGSLGSWADDDV